MRIILGSLTNKGNTTYRMGGLQGIPNDPNKIMDKWKKIPEHPMLVVPIDCPRNSMN